MLNILCMLFVFVLWHAAVLHGHCDIRASDGHGSRDRLSCVGVCHHHSNCCNCLHYSGQNSAEKNIAMHFVQCVVSLNSAVKYTLTYPAIIKCEFNTIYWHNYRQLEKMDAYFCISFSGHIPRKRGLVNCFFVVSKLNFSISWVDVDAKMPFPLPATAVWHDWVSFLCHN